MHWSDDSWIENWKFFPSKLTRACAVSHDRDVNFIIDWHILSHQTKRILGGQVLEINSRLLVMINFWTKWLAVVKTFSSFLADVLKWLHNFVNGQIIAYVLGHCFIHAFWIPYFKLCIVSMSCPEQRLIFQFALEFASGTFCYIAFILCV